MPQLHGLDCSVELSPSQQKLPEYAVSYGDAMVETFVAVPPNSESFAIHLTSSKYIAEGLAMYVFIDGQYQCNRNRQDLVSPVNLTQPLGHKTLVNFRVRQKEEKQKDGSLIAREWSFAKLDTNAADQAPDYAEHVLNAIGCIDIVVVRCRGCRTTAPAQLKPSSASLRLKHSLDGANDIPNHPFGLDGHPREYDDQQHYYQRSRSYHDGQRAPLQDHEPHHVRYIPAPPPYTESGPSYRYISAEHGLFEPRTYGIPRSSGTLRQDTASYHRSQHHKDQEYVVLSQTDSSQPSPRGHTYNPVRGRQDPEFETQEELFQHRTPNRILNHGSLDVADLVAKITRDAYKRAHDEIQQKLQNGEHGVSPWVAEQAAPGPSPQSPLPTLWTQPPLHHPEALPISPGTVAHGKLQAYPQSTLTGFNNGAHMANALSQPGFEAPQAQQETNRKGLWTEEANSSTWSEDGWGSGSVKHLDPWENEQSSHTDPKTDNGWSSSSTRKRKSGNSFWDSPVDIATVPAPFSEEKHHIAGPTSSSEDDQTDLLYNLGQRASDWGSEASNDWRSDNGQPHWTDSSSSWTDPRHKVHPAQLKPCSQTYGVRDIHECSSKELQSDRVTEKNLGLWDSGHTDRWNSCTDNKSNASNNSTWGESNATIRPLHMRDTTTRRSDTTLPPPTYGCGLPKELQKRLVDQTSIPPRPPPYMIVPDFARTTVEKGKNGTQVEPTECRNLFQRGSKGSSSSHKTSWDSYRSQTQQPGNVDKADAETGGKILEAKDNVAETFKPWDYDAPKADDKWAQYSWGDNRGTKTMPGSWAAAELQQGQDSPDSWDRIDPANSNKATGDQGPLPDWGGNAADNYHSDSGSTTKEWGASDADEGARPWNQNGTSVFQDKNIALNNDQKDADGWQQGEWDVDADDTGNLQTTISWDGATPSEGNNDQRNAAGGNINEVADGFDQEWNHGADQDDSWGNDKGTGGNTNSVWDNKQSSDQNPQDETTAWEQNRFGGGDSGDHRGDTGRDIEASGWENSKETFGGNGWGNENGLKDQTDHTLKAGTDKGANRAPVQTDGASSARDTAASTTRSRPTNYRRLRMPPNLQSQEHWKFPPPLPTPPARPSKRNPLQAIPEDGQPATSGGHHKLQEERPLLAIPKAIAERELLEHQINTGKGMEYEHCISRPQYLDSLDKPYAIFCFKYRSLPVIQKLFPWEFPKAPAGLKETASEYGRRLNTMSRDQLIAAAMNGWNKEDRSAAHMPVLEWLAKTPDRASARNSKVNSASKSGRAKNDTGIAEGGGWGDNTWGQDQQTDWNNKPESKRPNSKTSEHKPASKGKSNRTEAQILSKVGSRKAASNTNGWDDDPKASWDKDINADNGGAATDWNVPNHDQNNDSASKKPKSKSGSQKGEWGGGGFGGSFNNNYQTGPEASGDGGANNPDVSW